MAESGELIARWGEMELPFSVMRSARRTLRIHIVLAPGQFAFEISRLEAYFLSLNS